jgi:hypothetical protein
MTSIGFRCVKSLATTIPAPLIANLSLVGTNLVINAQSGFAAHTYTVLTSTSLASPLSQWKALATNVPAATGNFSITATNAITPGAPLQFYVLAAQ